jgi:predicted RNase H-like nuclease
MTLVLGVDGCRSGWCVVAIEVDGPEAHLHPAQVFHSFVEAMALPAEVICVDIPIGLLDRPGQRACDVEARRLLGPSRSSSVFPPPSRRSLRFDDYSAASDANHQLTGRWLTRQSFNIAPKVREVDEAMKPETQQRVREAHPELCFQALKDGTAMRFNKRTGIGREERWRVLRAVVPGLRENLRLPEEIQGSCQVDDYIDALVCGWTAVRVVRGEARRIPAESEKDERGLRMEMWVPS